ncbi:RimJ/RimL family protein N-acetyltransferase [Haloactinopolyspora alba]|uniref:RimJ/RimL family protein N-acetyltransferase n=1 Tax=Haloactinopolyspora alba TaxID=648780 RepID=A0A2P8DL16_9ACTN|nr:GNAT family N-acetyltransferase [Haloactinopolyspora alba]PSK97899.1 RimJ/RimL family protein N-acetyltransferase [Haloactinopolyspora alba]
MQPFELRTDGVLLAVPTPADIDRLTHICQDPEVLRWTSIPTPYTRQEAETFVEQVVPKGWSEERDLTWAVRDPDDRRVLGTISLRLPGHGRGEVGFMLAEDARGRGLMSRALRLVAEYAFDAEGAGLTHLGWQARVGNWASRRVAWATGFRMEGRIRGGLVQRGETCDVWVATLAAGEQMRPVAPWLETPTLHGERVTLRRFIQSDADAVVEACNDPVSQHWLAGLPSPYTRDIALTYIHDREEDAAAARGVHWAAALPEGGPAVGSFSLMAFQARDGGAELGYWMHPAARGKQLATEAVGLLAAHAFIPTERGGLGLRRLVVAHASGNDASRKVIERAGFRQFGVERAGDRIRGGTVVDLCWYDLLAEDT